MRGAPFVLAAVLLTGASRAEEQSGSVRDDTKQAPTELPLELTWSAPPGCATAEDIRHELGRITRARPGRTLPRVSADGRIERAGDAYRLTLHTVQNGVHGERSLVAKECRSLEREMTLVLALSFGEGVELVEDGDSTARAGSTDAGSANGAATSSNAEGANGSATPSGTGASSTAIAPPEAKPKASTAAPMPPAPSTTSPPHDVATERTASPPPSSSSRLHAAAFAGGGAIFRALPSPAAVVFAGADVGSERFDVEPRFVWIPGVDQTLPRDVRARYDGFGGSLAGCVGVPPFHAAMLGACVAFEAIALRGRSSGASEAGESFAPFFGAAPGLRWQWPATGLFALRLEAALHIALNEPRFVVVGLGEAYSVPRLAPSVGAALLLRPGR